MPRYRLDINGHEQTVYISPETLLLRVCAKNAPFQVQNPDAELVSLVRAPAPSHFPVGLEA